MAICTGFLSQKDFWTEEGDAPILKFNLNNWLEGNVEKAVVHANSWLASLGIQASRIDVDTSPLSKDGARIFRADANRTFRSEPNREVMIKLLSFAQSKFGDYQQSMGYVAGLMLLFFDAATAFKVLTVLNDHPKYLPGYWRGEATAMAVDGYVCLRLLREPIRAKLLSLGLLPETFVQKWFAGVCIHHLPFHLLFPFLDKFFAQGNPYLFQFFLAFFDEFEEDIMAAKANPEANMLIRFESAPEDRLARVIHSASEQRFATRVSGLDIYRERCLAFEDHLSRRLQSANEGMFAKRDDEITFSDEED
mmetsp:Transcript_108516/g.188432  ORF Transcript_108516/g.188432 Transcript_108516/m.188432 type:complete len:307 (-) Transcript_108516:69-989(-)